MQPLLFNTLQVRSALGAAQRRKLSFKNVSSVVVQLLHSIKYSMEVPFSNIATPGDHKANAARKVSGGHIVTVLLVLVVVVNSIHPL